jgi:hypothetical protein
MKASKSQKRVKLFLSIVLLASGIEAYALLPIPGSPIVGDTNTVISSNSCLAAIAGGPLCKPLGKCIELLNPIGNTASTIVENEAAAKKLFNISGKAGLTLGPVSGTLSGSYLSDATSTNNKLSMVFYYKVGWTARLTSEVTDAEKYPGVGDDIRSNYRQSFMDLYSKKVLLQSSDFFKNCGDRYVAEADAGFVVTSTINVEFANADDKAKVEGQINAKLNLGGSNASGSGDASGSGSKDGAEATIQVLTDNANISKVSKISVVMSQYGGKPLLLAKALLTKVQSKSLEKLSGDIGSVSLAIQSCSMSTADGRAACNAVQAGVMEYVANEVDPNTDEPKTTGQLYSNGVKDYTKLYYSNPVGSTYQNLPSTFVINSGTSKKMKDIIAGRQALEDELISVENAKASLLAAHIKTGDSIITLDGVSQQIRREYIKVDPAVSPFKECFSYAPDIDQCKAALDVTLAAMNDLVYEPSADPSKPVKLTNLYLKYKRDYERAILGYRIYGLPVISKVNGGTPEVDFTTCSAYPSSPVIADFAIRCSGSPSKYAGSTREATSSFTIETDLKGTPTADNTSGYKGETIKIKDNYPSCVENTAGGAPTCYNILLTLGAPEFNAGTSIILPSYSYPIVAAKYDITQNPNKDLFAVVASSNRSIKATPIYNRDVAGAYKVELGKLNAAYSNAAASTDSTAKAQ